MSADTLIVLLYTLLFAVFCRRSGCGLWLACAFAVWVLIAAAGTFILPGVLGLVHLQNLYLIPGCIFITSGLFRSQQRTSSKAEAPVIYLQLLAKSSRVMHAALAVLFVLAFLLYPRPGSLYVIPALLQMYLWHPLFWISAQWLLMLTAFASSRIGSISEKGGMPFKKRYIGGMRIAAAFLLAFIWEAAYVLTSFYIPPIQG